MATDYQSLFTLGTGEVSRDADISDCLRYRYSLRRWWSGEPWALFIMLNPSTADAAKDDPTIRRCMGFARSWGMGGYMVVNVFAWRATKPAELAKVADPIGRETDGWISTALQLCEGPVVAAWGDHKMVAPRLPRLRHILASRAVKCLGVTKDGHPRHPLYVLGTQPLVDFWPSPAEGKA